MASNYFSKPFGLHPTPATCFPPPPPPGGGVVSGTVTWTPFQCNTVFPPTLSWNVANDFYQTGIPINGIITAPGWSEDNPPTFLNNVPGQVSFNSPQAPGFYSGKLKLTWPNGQVRTFPFSYQIIP